MYLSERYKKTKQLDPPVPVSLRRICQPYSKISTTQQELVVESMVMTTPPPSSFTAARENYVVAPSIYAYPMILGPGGKFRTKPRF